MPTEQKQIKWCLAVQMLNLRETKIHENFHWYNAGARISWKWSHRLAWSSNKTNWWCRFSIVPLQKEGSGFSSQKGESSKKVQVTCISTSHRQLYWPFGFRSCPSLFFWLAVNCKVPSYVLFMGEALGFCKGPILIFSKCYKAKC